MPRSLSAFLVAVAVGATGARGQGVQAPSAQPSVDAPRSVVIPMRVTSYRPYIDVMVNGKGPYSFVMDTGAPISLVDCDLAKELGLAVRMNMTASGAGEGTIPAGFTGPVKLEFGGFEMDAPQIYTIGVNAAVAAFSGRPLHGIIGNDWMGQRVVTFDYAEECVVVHEGAWSYEGDGIIVPMEPAGHLYVPGEITFADAEPIKTRWVIDTGAGMTGTLASPFVKTHGLMREDTVVTTIGRGIGGEVRGGVARFDAVSIGGAVVRKPWLGLSSAARGAFATSRSAGIIGGEILARFTVTFDQPGRRMILEPEATFNDPFPWDMSGLVLTGSPEDDRLRVLRVLEGSPGAEAGILVGDVVVSIDGQEVLAKDRDAARKLLMEEGASRRVVIQRGEERVEVEVRLRRLVKREVGGGVV